MLLKKYSKLILSLAFTFLAGLAGSIFTASEVPTWYSTLNKPSFNPPAWLFAPVWTTLFILMAISLYLVWSANNKKSKMAVVVFVIHLFINSFWSLAFFGWHNPLLAFCTIILLWLAIIFLMIYFWRISKLSSLLLLPYILWVSFASLLNFYILILN
ncbi:MAG: TspO/MBR family protein [Candidatus Buchananbacteria bacterium]|nr:TspO/MBR family protein [Candidatus Buchananbacteria bacterium]